MGAFVPWSDPGMSLNDILCIQEQRTVNKDKTISYKGKCLQIPEQTYRCHFIKAHVKVCEYVDGTMAIFHGSRRLTDYSPQGELISTIVANIAA